MKAAQLNSYGGRNSVSINNKTQKPSPGDGEVLVEVHAASVNPFDWKVREGYMKGFIPLQLPATLGGDVSGVVAELGVNVSNFEVGQEVYGMANATGGNGSFAEFTPVNAKQILSKPQSIDFLTAAALPLTAISAYQAIVDHINLQSGQKILIHGGAGGIGSIAIQLASELGAQITTTATAADTDYVKGLGAEEVIDYYAENFSELLHDYDAVFDTIGGETNIKSYKVLKNGGILVSMVAPVDESLANEKNVQYVQQSSQTTVERLTKISELVDSGKLKVNVDKIFPLDQAAEALEYLKTSRHRGKVVIAIK